jgi:hypothetical protein
MGAATLPPPPPECSTKATTTISGLSKGAKEPNQAWDLPGGASAVPLLPATGGKAGSDQAPTSSFRYHGSQGLSQGV